MYKDVVDQDITAGSFVLYVTRERGAPIQFGYVEEFKTTQSYGGYTSHRVKLCRAEANGSRKNKFNRKYVPENLPGERYVLEDTGKPDYVWLDASEKTNRMLVTQPI